MSHPPEQTPTPPAATRQAPLAPVLAWSTALHVVSMLQVFIVPAMAPAMALGLGVSESLVGAQVMLVYTTATAASLYAGSLVVRLGAVRATQLSIATGAVGLALSAIPSVPVVALASVVLGVGYGLINPSTGLLLEAAVTPSRRTFAFSLKQSALPAGGMIAGAMVPGLAVALGWQGPLLLAAAASIVCAALLEIPHRRLWPTAPARLAEPARTSTDVGIVWGSPALRSVCLAVMAISGAQLILTTYLVTLLVQHVGIGLVEAGVALSCLNVGGIVGRVGWGAATPWLRSGTVVLAVMYGIALVLLIAFALATSHWPMVLVYALAFLLGSVIMGSPGIFVSELVRLAPPSQAARAIAGGYVFAFGGAQLGVLLFLIGQQASGTYAAPLWILVLLGAHGFLMSLRAVARLRAPGPQDCA